MCQIIFKPKGTKQKFSLKYMIDAYRLNDDGCGIVWSTGEHVHIRKGLKWQELLELVERLQKSKDYEDKAIIMHFRLATSGLVYEGTSHPFPLSQSLKDLTETDIKTDMAMAHNGIITSYNNSAYKYGWTTEGVDYAKNVKDKSTIMSDTMLFVQEILADPLIKSNLDNKAIWKLIKSMIASDRVVVIDGTGKHWLWGHFTELDGFLYSNDPRYGMGKVYGHYYGVTSGFDDDDDWYTATLPSETSYMKHYYCDLCGHEVHTHEKREGHLCPQCGKGYLRLYWDEANNEKYYIHECPACLSITTSRNETEECPHCGAVMVSEEIKPTWEKSGDKGTGNFGSSSSKTLDLYRGNKARRGKRKTT